MQLLFEDARATQDVDLVFKNPELLKLDANQRPNAILKAVQASSLSLLMMSSTVN